ncbi:MAG: hypothetical protein ACLTVB_00560 [Sutterella sp.]|uniref:Uncharacterized protein n=1 Tax=Myoviridae sp. ctakU3 TaxID=2825135 RepID=A0A8S5P316_9CAUD|nr:MAG TPA: hypothetical protein [Myoviridae sp. ctakU3]
MKRIILKCPVFFTLRKQGVPNEDFFFKKGEPYEVKDEVAENAFIRSRSLLCEDLGTPEAVEPQTETPEPPNEEAQNVADTVEEEGGTKAEEPQTEAPESSTEKPTKRGSNRGKGKANDQ